MQASSLAFFRVRLKTPPQCLWLSAGDTRLGRRFQAGILSSRCGFTWISQQERIHILSSPGRSYPSIFRGGGTAVANIACRTALFLPVVDENVVPEQLETYPSDGEIMPSVRTTSTHGVCTRGLESFHVKTKRRRQLGVLSRISVYFRFPVRQPDKLCVGVDSYRECIILSAQQEQLASIGTGGNHRCLSSTRATRIRGATWIALCLLFSTGRGRSTSEIRQQWYCSQSGTWLDNLERLLNCTELLMPYRARSLPVWLVRDGPLHTYQTLHDHRANVCPQRSDVYARGIEPPPKVGKGCLGASRFGSVRVVKGVVARCP